MKENNGNGASGSLQFDEEMCERYIFGELSLADQEKIEETYFSDDAFFERYLAVKTELLDLLARGEIDPSKRALMEPHFQATAPRRKRVEDAAMFSRSVTTLAQRRADQVKIPVSLPAENQGFAGGLIGLLSEFFMSPRAAALAALILAVGGGSYLMLRSPSSETSEKEIVLVSEEIRRSEESRPETAPEQPKGEELPGFDRDPRAIVSSERSSNDSSTILLRMPRRARATKWQSSSPENPTEASSPPALPTNERAAIGFALPLSTVDRDTGRQPGPAPTSGLNIGGQRGRQTSPAEGLTQSLVLRPGATRDGGQANTLVIRSGMDRNWAALTLLFRGDEYPDYVVSITNMAGKVVLKDDDFDVEKRPDGSNALSVWIDDTSAFKETEKDFIATLQGQTKTGRLETIEEYYFHIHRITSKPTVNDGKLVAAELSGRVVGPDGGPVPKAVVTAKNTITGVIRTITAQADGTYHMVQLPPGNYEVYAEAPTLRRATAKEVSLAADSLVELPIAMEAGGIDSLVRIENLPIIGPRPSITLESVFAAGSKGIKTITLNGDSQQAEIRLIVPNPSHSSYRAYLKTVSGKTILSKTLRRGRVLNIAVRSKLLSTGDHVIELTGKSKSGTFEPVAEFYFHVEKHK